MGFFFVFAWSECILVGEEVLLVSVLYLKKTKLTKLTSLGFSHFCFVFSFWRILLTPKFWQLWVTGLLDFRRARAKDQFYGSPGDRSLGLIWLSRVVVPRAGICRVCLWVKDEGLASCCTPKRPEREWAERSLSLSIICSPGVLATL